MTPRRRPWFGASLNREVWVDDDAPPGNLPASQMLEFSQAGRLVPPGEPNRAAGLHALMHSPEGRCVLRAATAQGVDIFDVAVYEEVINRQNVGRTLSATHQSATI